MGQDRWMGGHRKRHPDRDRNSDQHLAVCEVGTSAPCARYCGVRARLAAQND
jgi:hypothetical protein